MQLFEQYMMFIAISGSLFYFIQGYKIFKTKSVEGLSVAAFAMNLWIQGSWAIYGWVMGEKLIIFANTLNTIGVLLILVGILKYGKHKGN